MMAVSRFIRHMLTTRRQVNRHFPEQCLASIKSAIKNAGALHRGEIHFAIEAALHPAQLWQAKTAHERALEVFSLTRVWDTENNNGVLIYVLLADKSVEIIADRGIHMKIAGGDAWRRIVGAMQDAFADGRFEAGAVAGIAAVAEELVRHFPAADPDRGPAPNDVALL
jgi:uncharacterized membrane protein